MVNGKYRNLNLWRITGLEYQMVANDETIASLAIAQLLAFQLEVQGQLK